MTSHGRLLALAALVAALAACKAGPDYVRPAAPTAAAYKELGNWKPSQPQDGADRGAWWAIYKDATLDGLARKVAVSNQNLKAAEAAYRAAVAVVRQSQGQLFPTLTGTGSFTRSQAGTRGSGGVATVNGFVAGGSGGSTAINQYDFSLGASWDIDLWGRIRRTIESDVASAQASAADIASARLSAQGALATAYFQLRVADALQRLLDDTVEGYKRSLEITRNRYNSGTAARSDVAQAETQLESTQAQAINVGVQRAQLEHAIAVLIGEPPAALAIPVDSKLMSEVPVTPPGVPSTLLERRPDIAGAERRMKAANALIGVAIAAYYPDLTLSASTGFVSNTLGNLFMASSNIWSFGPQAAVTLLDFGTRAGQVDQARANYDQSVATYRQTVLTAFQQVEDELAALRILAEQAKVQDVAVRSAQEAERLIFNQYKAGTVDYTSVITAQIASLSNEEAALSIAQSRLVASVALIQALGGGWERAQIPRGGQIRPSPLPSLPPGILNTSQK